MYFYFYDAFLAHRRYAKTLERIETRLTDLGLEGRVSRFGLFKNVKDMLREAAKRGAETIVAVGNNDTIRKVVEIFPDFRVALGVIPLGAPTTIADFLGVPYGVAACDTLSARIVEKIDVGKVNEQYFLSTLAIPRAKNVKLTCEGKYAVTTVGEGKIEICNFDFKEQKSGGYAGNPRDGVLETFVSGDGSFFSPLRRFLGGGKNRSFFPLRRLTIEGAEPVTIVKDGEKVAKTTFTVEVAPEKLRIITGRGRKF